MNKLTRRRFAQTAAATAATAFATASLPKFALTSDYTSQELGQSPTQVQAKSGSARLPTAGASYLCECLEKFALILGTNPDAGIDYRSEEHTSELQSPC